MNCGRFTEVVDDVHRDFKVDSMKGEGLRKRSSWGVNPWRDCGMFRAK